MIHYGDAETPAGKKVKTQSAKVKAADILHGGRRGRACPRLSIYNGIDVVNGFLGHTTPPRAGSGVKGAPRSGAFIADP